MIQGKVVKDWGGGKYTVCRKDESKFYLTNLGDRKFSVGMEITPIPAEQTEDRGGLHHYEVGKPEDVFAIADNPNVTALDLTQDTPKVVPVPEIDDVPALKFLILAGFGLVLKALAPTCSVDQCCQSVLKLAIKLRNK